MTRTSTIKSESLALYAVALTAAFALAAHAYEGGLDTLLAPLSRLDIAGTYLRHYAVIDAILFFTIFLAVIHAALPERWKGRPGRAIAISLASMLTLALVFAERRAGFTLQDMGPVAVAIIAGTVAVVLYQVVHHLGMGAVGSGALALAVAYLGVRAGMPGLFAIAALDPWLAWLHLAAVVALLVFLGRAAVQVFHAKDIALGHAAGALDRSLRAIRPQPISEEEVERLEQERKAVSAYLQRIVDQPTKDSAEILADLAVIKRAVAKFGESAEARRLIAGKIRAIAGREHALVERLGELARLNEQLRSFDLRLLKRLQTAYERLPDDERSNVKSLFAQEVAKLEIEGQIDSLKKAFAGYDQQFQEAMSHLVATLRLGQPFQAFKWADSALAAEGAAGEIAEKIDALEKKVDALTRIPLSQLRGKPELVQGGLFG